MITYGEIEADVCPVCGQVVVAVRTRDELVTRPDYTGRGGWWQTIQCFDHGGGRVHRRPIGEPRQR